MDTNIYSYDNNNNNNNNSIQRGKLCKLFLFCINLLNLTFFRKQDLINKLVFSG